MYTVWHVDKYKIIFKLVINWTNKILQYIVVSSGLSRPGIIDARARRLRNTGLVHLLNNRQAQQLLATKLSNIKIATKNQDNQIADINNQLAGRTQLAQSLPLSRHLGGGVGWYSSGGSQPSGSLCCGRRWNFRKSALSTDKFKLKVF